MGGARPRTHPPAAFDALSRRPQPPTESNAMSIERERVQVSLYLHADQIAEIDRRRTGQAVGGLCPSRSSYVRHLLSSILDGKPETPAPEAA